MPSLLMLMPAFRPFPLPDRIDGSPNGINQGLELISMFPCSSLQGVCRFSPFYPFIQRGYVFTIGKAAHTL
jgi:hypothetical protein